MPSLRPTSALNVAAVACGVFVGCFVAAGAIVASALPYRHWDAFAFGTWSREIADGVGWFRVPDIGATALQRPLFYVGQGWLWRLFGFHETLGRLFSFAFALILLGSVIALGRRLGLGWAGGAIAGVLLLAIPELLAGAAAGLTDVPVAALVALTAALVWRPAAGGGTLAAAALAATAAVLTKPTALLAFAGLAAATLLGPRAGLRGRALRVAALVAGCLLGLVYDLAESSGVGLYDFLRAGTNGAYEQLADQVRTDTLLRADWLGADLRLLLWFAVAYALLRVVAVPHAVAAGAAIVVASAGSWLLPSVAGGGPLDLAGPFAGGLDASAVAYLLLLALLCTTPLAAADAPTRLELARLLVWAAPVVLVWASKAVYANRLLSPAWPALVVLLAEAVALAIRGARRIRPELAAAPALVVLLIALLGVSNLDSLGGQEWRSFWRAGPSGWRDGPRMERMALGSFTDELALVRREVRPGETAQTNDGRLRFFFGQRVAYAGSFGCDGLAGRRLLILLTNPDSAAAMDAGMPGSSQESYWTSCAKPRLELVAERPAEFAAWVVGGPPRAPVPADACPVPPRPSGTIAAVFARDLPAAQANALVAKLLARNFQGTRAERTGCSRYDVLLPGFPSLEGAREFVVEAKAAGYTVQIEQW